MWVRSVITESELRRFSAARQVVIPRGAIVTPLAMDYARENGIILMEADVDAEHAGERLAAMAPQKGIVARIARAALARLGRDLDVEALGREALTEALVTVIAEVLVRLGYVVVRRKGVNPNGHGSARDDRNQGSSCHDRGS